MRLPNTELERLPRTRATGARSAIVLVVAVLATVLFMPPWMLPRAAAMLPLAPVQNPSEEESHSSHSAAAQLQQLATIVGGRTGRITTRPLRSPAHPQRSRGVSGLANRRGAARSDLSQRNGCGGPLRC